MDVISHGLWGGIAFGRKRNFRWALFFGMLPDLLAFGPFYLYTKIQGIDFSGPPPLAIIPAWVFAIYDVSHSFFFCGLVVWVLSRFRRELTLPAMAWLLHIVIDIPTHSADYFPTRFLFPFSEVHFNGWPWALPMIWFPNLIFLVALYSLFGFSVLSDRRKAIRGKVVPDER